MPRTMARAAYADMYGPTTGDRVRLADTDLIIEVEKDFTTYGEEVKFGDGKVIRDGMGSVGSQGAAPNVPVPRAPMSPATPRQDFDAALADLHFGVADYAVGCNTSAGWAPDEDGVVRAAHTDFLPAAEVERSAKGGWGGVSAFAVPNEGGSGGSGGVGN